MALYGSYPDVDYPDVDSPEESRALSEEAQLLVGLQNKLRTLEAERNRLMETGRATVAAYYRAAAEQDSTIHPALAAAVNELRALLRP